MLIKATPRVFAKSLSISEVNFLYRSLKVAIVSSAKFLPLLHKQETGRAFLLKVYIFFCHYIIAHYSVHVYLTNESNFKVCGAFTAR